MHGHILHKQGGSSDTRSRFKWSVKVNRQLGVNLANVEALRAVICDPGADSQHWRVMAEASDLIDTWTAIAPLSIKELSRRTICLEWPQGLSEHQIRRTLKDLADWGYLAIDSDAGRLTIAQPEDALDGGAQ